MKDCRYFTNYLESYTPAVLKCITLFSKNNTPPHLFKGVILVEKLSTI
jgi:hypothetical protein